MAIAFLTILFLWCLVVLFILCSGILWLYQWLSDIIKSFFSKGVMR